jgi:serine/threonine protein kinase
MDGRADLAQQPDRGTIESAPELESIVGSTVGNYEVLDEIGRGGMGVVYLARQRGLERQVALKALHGATGLARRAGEALVKESRLAGSLSHANIVTVHEYLEEQGTPYIAMEYVPRGSLRPWMGCMSVAQLAGVLEDLLAGLAAVVPSGIVHRDLKPENVMVTADGHVKIADFGIAKATQQVGAIGVTSTPTGVTIGTPAYMAPEQALCQEVGPWTDLYSIGIIAYEHLVGQLPFHDAGTPMAMLLCHVRDPVRAAADVDARIDRALSDWVGRLLVKDPERRTQDPAVAWDELEEIVIGRLGAKWRRECRLSERQRPGAPPAAHDGSRFVSQKVTVERLSSTDPVFLTSPLPTALRTAEQPSVRRSERKGAAQTRRTRIATASLSAAALAAALGGFGIARAADSNSGDSAKRTVAGAVSASLPPGWSRVTTAAPVPAYEFSSPMIAQTSARAAPTATITVGMTNSASAALLPAGLIASGRATPRRETVTLRGRAFFRYLTPTLASPTGAAAVYTQPTTAGVLVAVCRLPAGASRSANRGCEQLLGTIAISDAHAVALAQSATYATSLAGIVRDFERERSASATRLANAPSAAAQASAARQLRQVNLNAAKSLRSQRPGASEASYNAALADAAERIASGYGEIASAAQGEHAARFKLGAGVVRAAWNSMRGTLTSFTASG